LVRPRHEACASNSGWSYDAGPCRYACAESPCSEQHDLRALVAGHRVERGGESRANVVVDRLGFDVGATSSPWTAWLKPRIAIRPTSSGIAVVMIRSRAIGLYFSPPRMISP
jgi:hypothetical protein